MIDFLETVTKLSEKPKKQKELKLVKGQQIGILKTESKVTFLDTKVIARSWIQTSAQTQRTFTDYTVPPGRVFYVTSASCDLAIDDTTRCAVGIFISQPAGTGSGGASVFLETHSNVTQGPNSSYISVSPPYRMVAGDVVIFQSNASAAGSNCDCSAIVVGYEEEVTKPY